MPNGIDRLLVTNNVCGVDALPVFVRIVPFRVLCRRGAMYSCTCRFSCRRLLPRLCFFLPYCLAVAILSPVAQMWILHFPISVWLVRLYQSVPRGYGNLIRGEHLPVLGVERHLPISQPISTAVG